MNSLVRSVLRLCCAMPLLFGVAFGGCAKQGEGERCDATNSGDDDCEAPLSCVRAEELRDLAADRCCRQDSFTDDRCRRRPIGAGGGGGNDASSDAPDSSEASDGPPASDGGLVCDSANDCADGDARDATNESAEADVVDGSNDVSDGAGGTTGDADADPD